MASLRRWGAWLAFAVVTSAHAETAPLWEAGAGAAVLSFPDYRGSDQGNLYLFPVPYLVYRGEYLKADRHGVRGLLVDTDRFELNISVNASLPVDSSHNRARNGMPDLEGTVELGPSLDVHLWRSADRRTRLNLQLPVRAAITVSSSPKTIGAIFLPQLNLDVDDVAGMNGWNLGILAGPIYASRSYNDYFYAVPQEYATATRPAYESRSGYSGTQYLLALSKRFPRYWVGLFVRYDDLTTAVFSDSPLVREKSYLAGGIAVSWILGESSQRVEIDDRAQ